MLLPFKVPFLLKPTVNQKLALRFPLSVGIHPPPVTRRSVLPRSTVRQASAEAVCQHACGSTLARTVYCPTARLFKAIQYDGRIPLAADIGISRTENRRAQETPLLENFKANLEIGESLAIRLTRHVA